jgi:4-hydroxy-tetrahydrodipicolinate synthase
MFKGVYTALVTPFNNGKVDETAFASLVEWQIEQGVHGLVPVGTTGESPTLTYDEHNRVVSLCIEAAKDRVHVMAGTGANNTEEAIHFTEHAKTAGADSALIASPYYNKPTQEGIYQHYKAIHDAVDIPIIVYNIPGRSVIDIHDETLARLAKLSNVVGIKDATGDLARISTLKQYVDDDFLFFSGEDMTTVGFNAMGGHGCISVTANIAPSLCAEVQNACKEHDYIKATSLHDQLVRLHNAMFCETSPGPAKYAISLMGKGSAELRLPLVEPSEANKNQICEAMTSLSLL